MLICGKSRRGDFQIKRKSRRDRRQTKLREIKEHPFHGVKNLVRHKKVRCRGLHKNTARLYTLFALANLVIAKKALRVPTPA